MDRLTHAEIGGPYSNRDDAERAIRSGAFHQDAAELTVQEGDSDDGTSKTSAFAPFQTPTTNPSPGSSQPEVPDIHGATPDSAPKTTKPSQIPGGGDNAGTMPMEPTGFADDTPVVDRPGPDSAMRPALGSIVAMIVEANPDADEQSIARVAKEVMRRLGDFNPFSMTPNIEDPLAGRGPFSDFTKLDGGNKKQDGSSRQQQGAGAPRPPFVPRPPGTGAPRGTAQPGQPTDDSGDTINPSRIFAPGERVPGAGAATGEAAAAGESAAAGSELLPLLLV